MTSPVPGSPFPLQPTPAVPTAPPLVAAAPQSPGMTITADQIGAMPKPPLPMPTGQPMAKPTQPSLQPMPGNPLPEPPAPTSPIPMQPTGRAPSATSPYAPPPPSSPGVGAPSPAQLAGFDQFTDAAYQQSVRRLDPQFQQMEDRFRQQMVNRGLAEGTEAYNEAFQNFSMDRNDAYAQARNQALAQALAAQGQAFGQGFQDRSLAQQARQFSDSLGFQYAGLNEQNRQFDANLGQRESEFGRQFGFQGQRADMQDLMALLGYGNSINQQNNALLNSDFNRAGGLFGMIPGMTPAQVDVMSPYQMQQQAWAMQNQAAGNASNGLWGAVGQLGAAAIPFLSDARLKTDVERVGTLDNGLPVYMARYTFGGPRMLMLMAQDVQEVRPEAVKQLGDLLAVDYEKAVA